MPKLKAPAMPGCASAVLLCRYLGSLRGSLPMLLATAVEAYFADLKRLAATGGPTLMRVIGGVITGGR